MDDNEESYRLCLRHAKESQLAEGTQRFELPVSSITLKVCGGEPSSMLVKSSGTTLVLVHFIKVVNPAKSRTLSVVPAIQREIVVLLLIHGSVTKHMLSISSLRISPCKGVDIERILRSIR